ncbi:MBL fold metallo-hydrolase [Actinomadura sp. NPDC047616]|uniref:pyrroloquinoline quinone biosynthesis protein PqqB n=1 Tax=Actinomadura sp. NPDC047616 TaxID=3155914 RepID=UPI0033E7113D
MRAVILGAAAGGGLPQWNCRCEGCRAARTGAVPPLTQSSLAIRAEDGPWHLVNVSPDVRYQLEALGAHYRRADGGDAGAPASFHDVVLTDAQLDHTLGLLTLRESPEPLTLHATDTVRRLLTSDFDAGGMLAQWRKVDWHPLRTGEPTRLAGGLVMTPIDLEGPLPRYAGGGTAPGAAVGLVFSEGDATLLYAPCVARLNDALRGHLATADCAMLDGTCWSDGEVAHRTARQMGHVPIDGDDGLLRLLERVRPPRTILVHLNNTNPVVLPGSPERARLDELGVEVAVDGMEVRLRP